jgi:hypothetical protein
VTSWTRTRGRTIIGPASLSTRWTLRSLPRVAVLVDPLREYPDTGLPFRLWCHLVSDASFEELHAFAAGLEIPRRFFQGDHYDLPAHLRARALELGAQPVTTRELLARMAGPRGERARQRARRRAVPGG